MLERIVLVQCTDTKRDEPTEAQDLYDPSRYFRRQRAYARFKGDVWYIQSAEHGLLHPDQVIPDYNTRPRDLEDPTQWAEDIAKALAALHSPPDTVVEVLGGKAYADPLTPALEQRGFDVLEPLRGLKIGERESQLEAMAT